MKSFIEITTIYIDLPDMIEVRVLANNGQFHGVTELYTHPEELEALVELIRGFPSDKSDTRSMEFGNFSLSHVGGGARLNFYCGDSLGHSIVEVTLQTDPVHRKMQSVHLLIPFVPGDLDNFLQEVEKMSKNVQGSASLISSFNNTPYDLASLQII